MSTVVKLALEGTHGTEGTTFTTIPCAFVGRLRQKNDLPEETRAVQDVNFAIIPGIRSEEWSVKESPVYHDTSGVFLSMALGAPTKVTVDTIFDNTWKFADDPKSASIHWTQARQSIYPMKCLYCVMDELTVAFDVNGKLTIGGAGVGKAEATASAPSHSFSTARPFATWQGAVTFEGGVYTKLLKGSVKVKRNRKPWFTIANSQDPTSMTIGDRFVEFELVCQFTDTVEYLDWKNAVTDSLLIKWQDAGVTIGTVSFPEFEIKLGTVAIAEGEIDDEQDLPTIKLTGRGLYNTGDASSIVARIRSSRDYTIL